MCKSETVCHREYLVGLLFRKISMKREEQNNRRDQVALKCIFKKLQVIK